MPAVIESPRNTRLQAARRLRRHPDDHVLAEGPQVVAEALRSGACIDAVYVTEAALAGHADLLSGVEVELLSERAMGSLADTGTTQGVVAVVARPSLALDELLAGEPARVLVLTDVRDPGNVGTALRAAEGAGFAAAVVCSGSCDPANSKAVRASAGAVFHLPHATHVQPEDALGALGDGGWRRIGAMAGGDVELAEADVTVPLAVAVGNEAWGFRPEVAALLDATVSIPMRGRISSLNAGVAAALVCYRFGPA